MAEATDPEVEQALMTATEVAAKLGWLSPSTAWDLVKRGRFPAPVRQHGRMKLWSRAQVENWERTAPRKPRRPASGIASS